MGEVIMAEEIEYTSVPHFQEILNYLPINPEDKEDINDYIKNISNLVAINYKYEQYQFAYFGIHLIYMTYIYCTAWKISQIEPERYKDAIVFAHPYKGREDDLQIEDADSIFNYSLLPEKDISKLFRIIDLDNSQIENVRYLVDSRNNMAHASGKIELANEETFEIKTGSVLNSIKNIHKCMDKSIRKWFEGVLLSFCNNEFEGYIEPVDLISEYMIQSFKLSINELLVCNNMSVSSLITEHRGFEKKLKAFKKDFNSYCKNEGYID